MTSSVLYDLTKLPISQLDWTSVEFAEDYSVALQLLLMGLPNAIVARVQIATSATQAKGGCSEMRTVQKHNAAMEKLIEMFPKYVRRGKASKATDEFSREKIKVVIQWKQAMKAGMKAPII